MLSSVDGWAGGVDVFEGRTSVVRPSGFFVGLRA